MQENAAALIGSKDKATQLACAFPRTSVRVVAKRANGVTVRYRPNHAKIACGASMAGALTCAFLILPSMAVRALIGGACDAANRDGSNRDGGREVSDQDPAFSLPEARESPRDVCFLPRVENLPMSQSTQELEPATEYLPALHQSWLVSQPDEQ